jgi:carbon monoxide dehydrogenase subunit G
VITVHAELTLTRDVPASAEEAFALLVDVPDSIAHFPADLEALDAAGDGWRWTFKKTGVGPASVQMVYAVRYVPDPETRTITWAPQAGIGNADVRGTWRVEDRGAGARLTLHNAFDLRVPLPRLLRRVAEPIVAHENSRMMRTYMGNLVRTLSGVAVSLKKFAAATARA